MTVYILNELIFYLAGRDTGFVAFVRIEALN